MEITYVTGNKMKVLGAKTFLEPLGFTINQKKIDCPEIQADEIEEVAKFSSKYASNELKCNVLKNDSGLIIPALNNFPGPYTKYAEETIKEDGILKLMKDINDRECYFIEVLAYTEYNKEPVTFKSITRGKIAYEKSGKYGWGYDYIFIPDGQTKTLASFEDEERIKLWDDSGYIELGNYLLKR